MNSLHFGRPSSWPRQGRPKTIACTGYAHSEITEQAHPVADGARGQVPALSRRCSDEYAVPKVFLGTHGKVLSTIEWSIAPPFAGRRASSIEVPPRGYVKQARPATRQQMRAGVAVVLLQSRGEKLSKMNVTQRSCNAKRLA